MITEKDLPLTLKVEDIAKILNIGRTNAYELVNSGEFRVVKVGKQLRIPTKTFLEWLYGREVA